ncbi:4-oxalocrotonate tautomerase DmpI [Maridesulfovibrio sp. FT414]|uniref:4-oxalocrotonate tautomerase DmpI n=1 Tax=Maridesulfovibrio sp. FT414 TaxID=2979469 RepID=UPI003D800D59
MPVITYAGSEMSEEKKRSLVEQLTEAASEVSGIPAKSFTVLIQEYPQNAIGIGGETLKDIKSRLADG